MLKKSLISKIKNWFESSRFRLLALDLITKNYIYKKIIFYLAYKKINSIEKSRRYTIAIEITNICNAKCIFCPNSKMKRAKTNMSDEVFAKIIERIKEERITPTYINLSPNGEPLIDKKIFEKINILNTNFPNAIIHIYTNLSLATKKIQKQLVESSLNNICVSLNADNKDDYRKIMGLDFDKTLDNLESLINLRNKTKSKLKIYVNMAANPINKSTVDKFLKRWGNRVDSVGVSWIHSWAGAVDNGDNKTKKIVRYPCRSLFEQINIHSNGDIPLCCVDYEGSRIGGNVMKDKLLDSINSNKINMIKKLHLNGKIDNIKMCSNCRFSERGLYWLIK